MMANHIQNLQICRHLQTNKLQYGPLDLIRNDWTFIKKTRQWKHQLQVLCIYRGYISLFSWGCSDHALSTGHPIDLVESHLAVRSIHCYNATLLWHNTLNLNPDCVKYYRWTHNLQYTFMHNSDKMCLLSLSLKCQGSSPSAVSSPSDRRTAAPLWRTHTRGNPSRTSWRAN